MRIVKAARIVLAHPGRSPVKLTFLGQESGKSGCPTLYATDRGTIMVQGRKIADAEALSQMDIPDHETVLEVPVALFRHLPREAG